MHRKKPHKAADQSYQTLLNLQEREGKLKLAHFRRVKQLGAGDVGLVDLVQLQVREGGGGGGGTQAETVVLWGCDWGRLGVESGNQVLTTNDDDDDQKRRTLSVPISHV